MPTIRNASIIIAIILLIIAFILLCPRIAIGVARTVTANGVN
jgi:hypothetical protein